MWHTTAGLEAAGIGSVTGTLEYVVAQGKSVKAKATHNEESVREMAAAFGAPG